MRRILAFFLTHCFKGVFCWPDFYQCYSVPLKTDVHIPVSWHVAPSAQDIHSYTSTNECHQTFENCKRNCSFNKTTGEHSLTNWLYYLQYWHWLMLYFVELFVLHYIHYDGVTTCICHTWKSHSGETGLKQFFLQTLKKQRSVEEAANLLFFPSLRMSIHRLPSCRASSMLLFHCA